MLAVETIGLTRRFGSQAAVTEVDLRVPAGCIYGFLGPNGAGKTTTLRMILGIIRADAGEVRLFGAPPTAERRIGSMVEMPVIYDHLTGRENLAITRLMLGERPPEVDRVLEVVDLRGAADRRAGGYSLGMRQRLGLARALIGSPSLLVLDEPGNGLDPDGMRDMRRLLRELAAGGTTILVSSHLLAEVDQLADHVGLMHGGRLVAQGPLADIVRESGDLLEIDVGEPARAVALLAAGGMSAALDGNRISLALPPGVTPASINRGLVEGGVAIERLALRRRSLEDAYLAALGGRDGAAEHLS